MTMVWSGEDHVPSLLWKTKLTSWTAVWLKGPITIVYLPLAFGPASADSMALPSDQSTEPAGQYSAGGLAQLPVRLLSTPQCSLAGLFQVMVIASLAVGWVGVHRSPVAPPPLAIQTCCSGERVTLPSVSVATT